MCFFVNIYRLLSYILCITILAFSVKPAVAGVLTVGSGSSGTSFSTIQDAIAAASSGDIISVAPGTYPEDLTISGKSLNIEGSSGNASDVVLQGKISVEASGALELEYMRVDASGESHGISSEGTLVVRYAEVIGGRTSLLLAGETQLFESRVATASQNCIDAGKANLTASKVTVEGCKVTGIRLTKGKGKIDLADLIVATNTNGFSIAGRPLGRLTQLKRVEIRDNRVGMVIIKSKYLGTGITFTRNKKNFLRVK